MSIEIEGVGYSVETRLIGKEDLLLDEYGNGVERSYEDVNGVSHKITPISSSTIPLPADIRASIPGSTNISDGMRSVLSKIADLSGGITSQGIMESDTTVVLTGTLSHAEKKTLIEQQYTNLGGKTLTIEFQESFDISTALFFEFKGFYNGTLIIDLNAVTISDSADAGQLFHIHDCSCKVEIKNGTISHSLSLYGIKAENCPAIYLNGIAFFGQDGDSNYAFYGLGVNGVISNCTYTEDNEVLLSDIGGASYMAYTDAKVIAGVTEHNESNIAHQALFDAHADSATAHSALFSAHADSAAAHQALFDAKAPLVHNHTASEEAAAASAVGTHNTDEEAHADLFGAVETLITQASQAVKLYPGLILPYGGSTAPTGYMLCDGSAISRETYSALFTAIGTVFGTGDGSTTFNIPDLRGKFIRGLGGDSGLLGAAQAEGLPNITGSFGPISSNDFYASGAFAKGSATDGAGDGGSDFRVSLDASRSSAIYGASSHVTPVNMAVNFIIRY